MFRAAPLWFAFLLTITPAFAIGPAPDTPPAPTPTTLQCTDGHVWDDETETCVVIEQSTLDEEHLRDTARELAYANRSADALRLLALSRAPQASEVLTLAAFAHGRDGAFEKAFPLYEAALAVDPQNLLARAYMGLALVAAGRADEAIAQLGEIRARGGRSTWPDRALATAIAAGEPIGY